MMLLMRIVAALLACLSLWGAGCGGGRVSEERLHTDQAFRWTQRQRVRAFYSGHSLSDGVPEAVHEIARSLGRELDFEFQSMGYSLLRERTRGSGASTSSWDGYKRGKNRNGEGLDVASELRKPRRLAAGGVYDALVVTERHDLPDIAAREGTATNLAHMAQQLLLGNPQADVFFYHTWLEIDAEAPEAWIAYERRVQRMWECIASRANQALMAQGACQGPRIRVLPGAAALAQLVEHLFRDAVPGLDLPTPADRVRLLFADHVHLSPLGTYFMGLVHYAVLFGRSPVGATRPKSLPEAANAFVQHLAQQIAAAYAPVANGAAQRDMEACRDFAKREMCHAYYRFRGGAGLLGRAKSWFAMRRCQRDYDPHNPLNPFRALK